MIADSSVPLLSSGHHFLFLFFFTIFESEMSGNALANKTSECMFIGCYKLFILEVLLLYRENQSTYFSVCCSAVNVAINSNTVQWTDNTPTHTHTHRHNSDIDMAYFSSLITYRVSCGWYMLNVNANVWDILTSTASPRSVSESALHFTQCVSIKPFLEGRSMTFHNCLFLSLQQVTF